VKEKVLASMLERNKLTKKMELVEDVKAKIKSDPTSAVVNPLANLKLAAPVVSRYASTQIQNRNYSFEDSLRELSENMLEVMESKPNANDNSNYEELKNKLRGLRVKLLPHQCYALKWLKWRENHYPNGSILADDMGLGKTLTTLAYLKLVKEEREQAIKKRLE
jgi:SNF2 family DNA or RNA helicase